MRKKLLLVFAVVLLVILPACGTPAPAQVMTEAPAEGPLRGSLVIYSGRSEALTQPAIDAFTAKFPDVEVLLKSGNNSELANALLEEQNNPQADVFVTTELLTVQSLAQQNAFESYSPAAADQISTTFIGPENLWVGLTRRVRVIMYNTELVSEEEAPKSIFELTDPKWRGQIALAGSTNGSMQAQIAAMRQLLGEEATESWLRGLIENEATFFGGHTDVRKAVGAGEFKIGLVNHYYYYLQKAEGSPVGIIFPDQEQDQIGLITNATAVGIIQGTKNRPIAEAFVDFLLSEEGQKIFAEANYEYPLLAGVALHPDVQPLDAFRLSDVNVSQAAQDVDATFALIEKVNLP
ncbi:MAG TPA: extracellular solute-binding protein [Anaerolineales bacterium]|nr:extracellular solute-binding protein [Anaerolineales bacterium]